MFTRTARATARSSLVAGHLRTPIAPPIRTAREATLSSLEALSQAIKTAPSTSTIYLSGQIPADANGTLIQGSMADKTAAIINSTKIILEKAGSGLDQVVKVVVYLKDARAMPEFAKVYDPAFPHRPARSMVEVSALPAGVDVQVDFVAVGES
ncbi:RidA family protein [Aspergillus mulundensis]|uniref:YjgF-like protein n=1 Tax=Aspergillus mulundensis TaxID=1810919 RepID=A0A3D8QBT5_9EURO|nr:hypothetical protein DSM5745_11001 [Aspergillus mulundensis]RDW59306.1 hypothetical protein DSM5745_11001 [Aspergillus mulundensis]